MSHHQPEALQTAWRTAEDIETTLIGASKISQGPDLTQRAYVPPAPIPEHRNKLPNDPLPMFSRRQNGQSIMGRGQMILAQERNFHSGYHDHRIYQDLRGIGVSGWGSESDTAIRRIICKANQFDDTEEDQVEPHFSSTKNTSSPSMSGMKEAVTNGRTPSPSAPRARVGLDFTESPQDTSGPSGLDNTNPPLDLSCLSEDQPDVSSSLLDISSEQPDQQEIKYADPFYYKFDDSVYMKIDTPVVSSVAEAPTPSPCSSPLPHHSTIDGHYVGCVQMESDSSSSPSPVPVDLSYITHQNAAHNFITKLRSTLPDDYNDVLSVWKDYQAGQITSSALELQISRLLGPYPDLLDAFFKFTSLTPDEEADSFVVESSNGEVHDEPNTDVLDVPDEPATEVLGEPIPLEKSANELPKEPVKEEPEKSRAELFEDYIRFCRLVRAKFVSQPDVFSQFLALLNDHKEAKIDKNSLIDQVGYLFRSHLELLEGFKKLTAGKFCSVLIKTAGSIAANSALKKVARLTDSTRPRRCRNALILGLLKKEAASKCGPLPAEGQSNEVISAQQVSDRELADNHAKNVCEISNKKTLDENGNSDLGESVRVLNDSSMPSTTTLGYNSADVGIGIVSSTVLENSVIDSCNDVVQTEPLSAFPIAESNHETVSDLEIVHCAVDGIRPLPIQDKPLELLKPEDIIPDMNVEIPHSTLEIPPEMSSVMDSSVVSDVGEELEVVSVENGFIGSSEGGMKTEIELLKPSDFVHQEPEVECDTTAVLDDSATKHTDHVVLDAPEELIIVELADEMASSDSVEVLVCPEELIIVEPADEMASSDSVEVLVCSCDEPNSADAISSSAGILSSVDEIVIPPESATSSADGNQSSVDVSSSTESVPPEQDQCCDVDSTSDPLQPSAAPEIERVEDTEQTMETVVTALANMDLNSDLEETKYEEPVVELELSGDTEVYADALLLPPSSDEWSDGKPEEIAADEMTGAEVTMTVRAIPSDLRTSSLPDVDLSPDQVPGSVPQVTPDSGPLLIRPDQFVTLSTAVDPHQVEQALQKHSLDLA